VTAPTNYLRVKMIPQRVHQNSGRGSAPESDGVVASQVAIKLGDWAAENSARDSRSQQGICSRDHIANTFHELQGYLKNLYGEQHNDNSNACNNLPAFTNDTWLETAIRHQRPFAGRPYTRRPHRPVSRKSHAMKPSPRSSQFVAVPESKGTGVMARRQSESRGRQANADKADLNMSSAKVGCKQQRDVTATTADKDEIDRNEPRDDFSDDAADILSTFCKETGLTSETLYDMARCLSIELDERSKDVAVRTHWPRCALRLDYSALEHAMLESELASVLQANASADSSDFVGLVSDLVVSRDPEQTGAVDLLMLCIDLGAAVGASQLDRVSMLYCLAGKQEIGLEVFSHLIYHGNNRLVHMLLDAEVFIKVRTSFVSFFVYSPCLPGS
jgi:hypothetical protein